MRKVLDPKETKRGQAFELWMSSPMPMVTLTKTFDVTRLVRTSRRKGWKFNMLLCWCIAKAAQKTDLFLMVPFKDGLYLYDRLAVNVIVKNREGGINSCDIPCSGDLMTFNEDYLRLTREAAEKGKSSFLDDEASVVGTSALVDTALDSIVNQYTDRFLNPMVMWGRYRKGFFKTTLPISFQFHHVQMDGMDGAKFLENLQKEILDI